LSRWWDDATAIGMANALQDQGQIHFLGVVSDVPNKIAVAALDAIDTAYGHPDLPVGALEGSQADSFQHGYTDTVVEKLKHSIKDSSGAPESVALYRKLLKGQPNHSVTIVSLGGYTNIAKLLESSRSLIAKKVK